MLARAWNQAKTHEPLIIVSSCVTMVFMNWHMVGPVLPRFALNFGVTVAEVSLLISAFTLARVFLNFPAGALTERIGRRSVFITGGLIAGLASIGSGLVNDFSHLVALRFLTGAGGALAITVQSTIMVDISTRANRGRMMSFSEGIVTVGLFLGPAAGGLLGDALGLRVPFFLSGALTLLFTAWAVARLPETRGWNAEMEAHLSERVATRAPLLEGLKFMLTDRSYVMIGLVAFANFFTRFGTLFFMLPILAYSLGMSPGEYGLVASGIALIHIPLLPLAGSLADRYGRKAVIVPGTILTGITVAAFGLAPNRELFLAAVALYAVMGGIAGLAPSAYLADISPAHLRGMSIGLYRTVGDIAGFIGPIVVGYLAVIWTQGDSVVANGVLVSLVGCIFGVFARESYSSRGVVYRGATGK
jgi:MFS family permease